MYDFMNQQTLAGQFEASDVGKTVPLIPANQEEVNQNGFWDVGFVPGVGSENPAWEQNPGCHSSGEATGWPGAVQYPWMLVGEKGVLAGNRFEFRVEETKIGVDPAHCQIVLPLGTPGVSRQHLRFWIYEGIPSAMDLGSTYGSYYNGERMKPGLLYQLNLGDCLLLGGGEEFRVE